MDPSVAPGRLVGDLLDDRYRLQRRLRGGDGVEVYEAEDQRLERRVEVHVAHAAAAGATSLDLSDQDMLDGGEHDGHPFFVFALADPAPVAIVGNGRGDEEPTGELPTSTDRTAVLPVPLLPTAAPEPSEPPAAGPGPAGTLVGALWARRGLLVAVAAVLLVGLAGLAARNDGVDVPTGSSVPITAETATTIAPTTTSPPTTQEPARGKGKDKERDEKEKDDD